jgi:hypothetical protein
MPMLSITIDNLYDGQMIDVSYEVTGSVSPAASCSMMARQIDDNALQSLAFDAGDGSFSFEITAADCPNPGEWYLLNVYAWDVPAAGAPSDLYIKSVTFQRTPPGSDGGDGEIPGGGGPS